MFRKDTVQATLSIDRGCVFVPINPVSSEDSCVTGRLHLHLSQAILGKSISVKLVGRLKILRDDTFTKSYSEGITYERNQVLATSKMRSSFELPAGTYDFPFELPLERKMMDTLMGPGHEYHSYQVHAALHRRFAADVRLSQPIIIYRSPLHQIDIEEPFLMSEEGQIDEKLNYRVTIPSQNIPFGSSFPVDLHFAPFRKDLKPGAITLQVMEKHQLQIPLTASETVTYNSLSFRAHKSHLIFSQTYDEKDWNGSESELLDLEWSTSKLVHLPQDLQSCTQTVQSRTITVNHTLCFQVDFKDEDGDVTTVSGNIPFNVYMCPRAVMENGTVYWQNLQELKQDENQVPPLYGAHSADPSMLLQIPPVYSLVANNYA